MTDAPNYMDDKQLVERGISVTEEAKESMKIRRKQQSNFAVGII